MGERLVPDAAGWWWLAMPASHPQCVYVADTAYGLCFTVTGNGWVPVEADSVIVKWLGPCPTPDEFRALTAERDALAAKVARVEALRDELRARHEDDERAGHSGGRAHDWAADRITEALEAEDE